MCWTPIADAMHTVHVEAVYLCAASSDSMISLGAIRSCGRHMYERTQRIDCLRGSLLEYARFPVRTMGW